MANEFGKDWRVMAKVAAAFVAIGGEKSLSWKRSSAEQDISDKDSGVYGATSYGQQKITFSIGGNVKLPDPGFAAVEAASKTSPPQIEIQIMKGDIIKYHGMVAIGNFSADFPNEGPATYSLDMANSAAPILDAFSAVANA